MVGALLLQVVTGSPRPTALDRSLGRGRARENAGVVDLGDGWLAALRIESHNHPRSSSRTRAPPPGWEASCATCSPWALVRWRCGTRSDSARSTIPLNRYLFSGVVAGIAAYGNAVGVPTVGGELDFEECYSGNPLVNVMCLGVMRKDQLVLGTAGPSRDASGPARRIHRSRWDRGGIGSRLGRLRRGQSGQSARRSRWATRSRRRS